MKEDKDNKKKEMILFYARKIYEVLDQGDFIDLSWQEEQSIIVPGKLPKVERIIINRPKEHIIIKAT